jgi:hypothetical protein
MKEPERSPAPLPVGAGATVLLLSFLPKLTVRLSEAPAGRRLRAHLDDRQWGILHSRLAQGVLELPQSHACYLRGRSRQALRTNMRRAQQAGIACRSLDHVAERRAATLHLRDRIEDRLQWADELFCLPGDWWWSAYNRRREAVALVQVTVDREWAMLQSFVSNDQASRYLLHSELVKTLIAAQVRYLVVNAATAPLLEPPVQYWQQLLGFRVANLSVRAAPIPDDDRAALPAPAIEHPSESVDLPTQEAPALARVAALGDR